MGALTRFIEPKALQHAAELDAFVQLVKDAGVTSYLEIGSKFGGSLWRVGSALPPGSKIVSVDLQRGAGTPERLSLERTVRELQNMGHKVILIWGDSTQPTVISTVGTLAPFDLALIDANHTEPYVRDDWKNYGSMASIVAFHDIAWFRKEPLKAGYSPIDVPHVWRDIKRGYHHREIKLDPTGQDNGFGVIWRDREF